MSIFFGVMIMIVVTLTALVINVGLFVKAKINLQNAVDAAAFSGAAVQARQLSNISYINWEMRNIYKEWMFKYYILGQKGMSATIRDKINDGNLNPGKMNFRLRPFYRSGEAGYDPDAFDPFNVPSICVKHSGQNSDSNQNTAVGFVFFKNNHTNKG